MLLPSSRFFAPTPSVHDLHLLYRDHLPDGEVSRWYEVQAAKPTKFICFLWNPGRRHNKALFDVAQHLARQINQHQLSPEAVKLSVPYIMLLNFVSSLPRTGHVAATQFLLMRTDRLEGSEPRQFFVSAVHSVGMGRHAK